MFKKRWRTATVIILLAGNTIITFYATPYIKQLLGHINLLEKDNEEGGYIDISKKDEKAHIAVVIADNFLIGEEIEDCNWARDIILSTSKRQLGYIKTEKCFGHTGFVFQFIAQEKESPVD